MRLTFCAVGAQVELDRLRLHDQVLILVEDERCAADHVGRCGRNPRRPRQKRDRANRAAVTKNVALSSPSSEDHVAAGILQFVAAELDVLTKLHLAS